MPKITVVFLILLVFNSVNNGKATTEKSEEKANSTEHITNDGDEDESASIQVVQRDVVTDTLNTSVIIDSNPQEEETFTEVLNNTNTTTAEDKHDNFFEDLNAESAGLLENQDDNMELSLPADTSIEIKDEYSNRQEQIEIAIEDVTETYNHAEDTQENSATVEEDGNNWRSAENDNSGDKKYASEPANEEISAEDDDTEEYMDKKIDLEVRSRMETRIPEQRRQKHTRPTNARLVDHEDHDSNPIRTLSDIVVPSYRPVLTRAGIVYTPTLLSMQSRSPLLDRLSGHNWAPSRLHMNPEESFPMTRQNRVMVHPQYDETKMIDDYNDYGANTYSYMPSRKVTTQKPPQQILAPNKFDVFQKLVEASNHPKSQKRMFNEYHQRSYPESYG